MLSSGLTAVAVGLNAEANRREGSRRKIHIHLGALRRNPCPSGSFADHHHMHGKRLRNSSVLLILEWHTTTWKSRNAIRLSASGLNVSISADLISEIASTSPPFPFQAGFPFPPLERLTPPICFWFSNQILEWKNLLDEVKFLFWNKISININILLVV